MFPHFLGMHLCNFPCPFLDTMANTFKFDSESALYLVSGADGGFGFWGFSPLEFSIAWEQYLLPSLWILSKSAYFCPC